MTIYCIQWCIEFYIGLSCRKDICVIVAGSNDESIPGLTAGTPLLIVVCLSVYYAVLLFQ